MKKIILFTGVALSLLNSVAFAQQRQKGCADFFAGSVSKEYLELEARTVKSATGLGVITSVAAMAGGYMYIKTEYPTQDGASNLMTGASTTGGTIAAGVLGAGHTVLSLVSPYESRIYSTEIKRLDDDAYIGEGQTLERYAEKILLEMTKRGLTQHYNNSERLEKKAMTAVSQVINETPEICAGNHPAEIERNIIEAALKRYSEIR
jgi:hypothetical protein